MKWWEKFGRCVQALSVCGLEMGHQIAKAHAGTLVLAASNHDGTTFAVELPRSNARLQG
jgi:sensor histidine kinase regulating citrate/malate metabolism